MEPLASLKDNLTRERSVKLNAVLQAHNPVERELLERELTLLDAQMSWVEEAMAEGKNA